MNREDLKFLVRSLVRSLDGEAFTRLVKTAPLADVAEALAPCSSAETSALLMTLTPDLRAALFAYFSDRRQDQLLQIMPATAVVELFKHLPSDDRADAFNRLSESARQRLLPALANSEREDLIKLAGYEQGTAGSEMTSEYATLIASMTVEQAFVALRASAFDRETIDVVFVLDTEQRLLGTLTLRTLVLADPASKVSDLMTCEPVFVRAQWPKEMAVEYIRRYDLLALPVLSSEDRMLGIVTVDDAMDIEKEQDATQLARFGGTAALGGPDLDILLSPFNKMFGVRVFWLSILTFFGIFVSSIVAAQEDMLSEIIILAAFLAPIIDMGGNTGSQSAALVIRAMALGDVTLNWRHVWQVLKREIPVAMALGVSIGVLEVILAYFSKGVGIEIMLVVGLSMMVCTMMGGVIGVLLPFLARRIGTDPATLSSPLITSIMDMVGVCIYFGFAYLFLSDMMTAAA
ncbi:MULTISPECIES: magnesium transporter [unclassified Pseudomonas]|uniref:magnesium transporter n=1 Tax=unclassified Pseudomonas TaxID=196821 RepID=UPI002AC93673|nr:MULTISPECIES: magnesium transporter [unclassified Pseudomonas]MEB0045984.1 magnesium transporter [Pseudomonas sp. Dout3]MEB0097244.1 magnesium transporter [Pseudomonas sp. DC1.2]WPX56818.1 magnesium transporter [Pseudomonas sp. DC1.2]